MEFNEKDFLEIENNYRNRLKNKTIEDLTKEISIEYSEEIKEALTKLKEFKSELGIFIFILFKKCSKEKKIINYFIRTITKISELEKKLEEKEEIIKKLKEEKKKKISSNNNSPQ